MYADTLSNWLPLIVLKNRRFCDTLAAGSITENRGLAENGEFYRIGPRSYLLPNGLRHHLRRRGSSCSSRILMASFKSHCSIEPSRTTIGSPPPSTVATPSMLGSRSRSRAVLYCRSLFASLRNSLVARQEKKAVMIPPRITPIAVEMMVLQSTTIHSLPDTHPHMLRLGKSAVTKPRLKGTHDAPPEP